MIPTAIALLSAKYFGRSKGDPKTALAHDPVAAFVIGAMATGDTDAAGEMLADDAAAYMNGSVIINPLAGDAPSQFRRNVEFWRAIVPDLRVEVFDEIEHEERHKARAVAVRFVVSGTAPGAEAGTTFEFEAAAFLNVDHGKATLWRVVSDPALVESLRPRS